MNENERLRTVVKANDGFYLITTRPVRIGGLKRLSKNVINLDMCFSSGMRHYLK